MLNRILSRLIDLTAAVTTFFLPETVYNYKIDPQEQKLGVTI